MFCSKCGSEIISGEQFCHKCGTKVGTTGNNVNLNLSTGDVKNKAVEIKSNFISGVVDLGKYRVFFLGNVLLLILSLIFSFTNTFDATLFGESRAVSLTEEAVMKWIFAIAYITATVFLVSPLLFKKSWSPWFFLPTKIVTILSSLYFFLLLFVGLNEAKSGIYASLGVEFNITATGWLFIVTTIGALVLAYKNTYDLKKLKASLRLTAQNTSQTYGE